MTTQTNQNQAVTTAFPLILCAAVTLVGTGSELSTASVGLRMLGSGVGFGAPPSA